MRALEDFLSIDYYTIFLMRMIVIFGTSGTNSKIQRTGRYITTIIQRIFDEKGFSFLISQGPSKLLPVARSELKPAKMASSGVKIHLDFPLEG
jgi:hypothetical protein